jgi:hypothetical protein
LPQCNSNAWLGLLSLGVLKQKEHLLEIVLEVQIEHHDGALIVVVSDTLSEMGLWE